LSLRTFFQTLKKASAYSTQISYGRTVDFYIGVLNHFRYTTIDHYNVQNILVILYTGFLTGRFRRPGVRIVVCHWMCYKQGLQYNYECKTLESYPKTIQHAYL